ncbi:hypothetical protein [Pyruvatibacter sp.]|uniref:hypothetical protein n=1 Tax=Pyruvatibacter sp. TaxID=1981328 RepID=UPI0032652932
MGQFFQNVVILVGLMAAVISIYQFSLPKPFAVVPSVTFEACQPSAADTAAVVKNLVSLRDQVVLFEDLNVLLLNLESDPENCAGKLTVNSDDLLPIQVGYFTHIDILYPEMGPMEVWPSTFLTLKFPTSTEGSYSARYLKISDDSMGVEYKGPMFVSFTDSGGSADLVFTPVDIIGASLLEDYQCTLKLRNPTTPKYLGRLACM